MYHGKRMRWQGPALSFSVRDVLAQKDLAVVQPGGSVSAAVDAGDTKLFVLTAVSGGG